MSLKPSSRGELWDELACNSSVTAHWWAKGSSGEPGR